MFNSALTSSFVRAIAARQAVKDDQGNRGTPQAEDGFEIAQSMGIALLGLVVAATFAGLLEALGVEIIQGIRDQIGL